MRALYCLIMVWLLATPAARAQVYPNLGFEPGRNHGQPLLLWSRPPTAALDSTVAHGGRASLRLDLPAGTRQAYVGLRLTPDSARGQLLTVRVWVRRQGWRGRLTWRAGSSSVTVAGLSGESAAVVDSVQGTADWQPLTLHLPVKATAFDMGLSLQAEGSGRLWLDDITFSARGRVLPELPLPLTEAMLLPVAATLVPNWGLERLPPTLTRPVPAVATLRLDSLGARQGRYALRVQRSNAPGPLAPVVYLGTLPIDLRDAGKTLTIRGYWRRPEVAPAATGPAPQLAVRLQRTTLRDEEHWASDTLGYKPVAGPAPGPAWSAFTATAPLQLFIDHNRDPISQAALSIGVRLPDARPLELDDLTFAIDGRPYAPTGPPVPPPPSTLETAWLRAALRPLRLAAPATAASDVAALGSYLAGGSTRLLGLGELSHGSHEGFVLHGQLVRYLVSQGYTGLLLEAEPLACEALQAYVRTGQGDPARLLAALHDRWDVPEMLDLLRWLRQYQQAHPATPLLLAGLDLGAPEPILAALQKLAEPDDTFTQHHLAEAARLLAAFPHPAANAPNLLRHPAQENDSLLAPLRRVLAELTNGLESRAQVGGHPTSLAQLARRRYYLRLLEQGAVWQRIPAPDTAATYRQACLAENAWYQRQQQAGSTARLLLWGNNQTVAHGGRGAGSWLHATLGLGYRALGTVLGEGQVAARGPDGTWQPMPLAPLRPGAYEVWLHTGPATSWLPLSGLELTDDNAWLFQQQLLRDLDRRAQRNQYQLHTLRDEFDAVVYLGHSSATVALP